MRRVLFALFPDRTRATSAGSALPDSRLHEREVDLMLGVDLSGTASQRAGERQVAARFGLVFAACAGLGLALDLSGAVGDIGLSATMAFGSVGILLGTLTVLLGAMMPLDGALTEVGDALEDGGVLLTVPVEDSERAAAEATVTSHGGHLVFEA